MTNTLAEPASDNGCQYQYKNLTEHDIQMLKMINDRTVRAAEIFITMVPILVVYPVLQRYFTEDCAR